MIADKLLTVAQNDQAIAEAVEDIRLAIVAKDVPVAEGTPISQYPAKIAAIEGGGGETPQNIVKATYIDYDGTILKEEYGAVGFTPTPPADPAGDDIRIFSKWIGIQENLQEDTVIGASFNFGDDYRTYIYIDLDSVSGLFITMAFAINSGRAVIDWGDGTVTSTSITGNTTSAHTYSQFGKYCISIDEVHLNPLNKFGWYGAALMTPIRPIYKAYIGYPSVLSPYTFNYNSSDGNEAVLLKSICFSDVNVGASGYNRAHGFTYCRSISALVIPAAYSLTDYANFGLAGCKYLIFPQGNSHTYSTPISDALSLEYVLLPDTISRLKFTNFYNLRKYKIGASVTRLESNAFAGCVRIEEILIPETVTVYGLSGTPGLFEGCYNIKKIDVRSSASTISSVRFIMNCYNLRTLIFRREVPPTINATSGFTPRANFSPSLKIYVPDASVETYKTTAGWTLYADLIYPISQLSE